MPFRRVRQVLPRLAFCALAPLWSAAAETPPLITKAMEYSFPAEAGKVYEIQGTADGVIWSQAAGPFFGNDEAVTGFFPLDSGAGADGFREYRVNELDPADFGPVPSSLANHTVVLNDAGRPREVIFANEMRGFLKTDSDHLRTFTYRLRRVASRALVAELTYFDDTRATLELDFASSLAGGYRLTDATTNDTDKGGFSLHAGRLRSREANLTRPDALPGELVGTDLVLSQAGSVTLLHFNSQSEVTLTLPDGGMLTRPYSYDPSSDVAADLHIFMPGDTTLHVGMTLTSETTGSTTTETLGAGGAPLPGSGGPTPGDFNVPKQPAPSENSDCPPKDLDGESLYLTGSEPVTLTFNKDGTGKAIRERNGSVEVTPFEYDYEATGNGGAAVAVTFPGATNDTVEDYDFEYGENCTGTFRRNDYTGGELTGGGQGSFGPGGVGGSPPPAGLVMGIAW